jgi:TDG/mug DNA glycosylase family protein
MVVSRVTTTHGLSPIARVDAVILILGTMPGKASLRAEQYYAHGGNVFWKLVASILSFDASSDYDERVNRLIAARIAVWDVLKLCTREGSLDSDIVNPVANDFGEFFTVHPQIRRVCFNGAKAADLYKEHVREKVTKSLEYVPLPSTSPANASVPFAAKREAWAAALQH